MAVHARAGPHRPPLLRTLPRTGGALRFAAAALAAATALLPREAGTLAALILVIGLGVPHGALDGEIARGWLRPRFGCLWFPVFALPYLLLAAGVLAAWRLAPLATLAGFLAVSVLHFGEEDAGGRAVGRGWVLEVCARGGLPVALPTLVHPDGVARVFGIVTATSLAGPPAWLMAASWLWLVLAFAWASMAVARRQPVLAGFSGLALAFLLLPPLSAFALYFVAVHAPRHIAALIADPRRAPRVRDTRAAALRSLPILGLTLALGALLWPAYAGPVPERLLALTFQSLAALTLPHLVLERISDRLASGGEVS